MGSALAGKRVAFVATDGVEEVELVEPRRAIQAEGGEVELIAPGAEAIQAMDGMDKAGRHRVDGMVAGADPADYDALVLPGGVANPDKLRRDGRTVEFVRGFFELGKPVGVICHGPWTLIEARVVEGRTLTSFPSLRTDLENAGATWVDEEVHVDAGLVSSRHPGDLPAFCAKVVEEVAEGRHAAQSRSAA